MIREELMTEPDYNYALCHRGESELDESDQADTIIGSSITYMLSALASAAIIQ